MSMADNFFVAYVKQLGTLSPLLLVYLAGMIVALVLWRRSPVASVLCLLGLGLGLVATAAQPLANLLVVRSASSSGWSADRIGLYYTVSGVIGSLVRAAALGLMVAAVFVGRKKATRPLVEVEGGPTRPGSHGITRPQGGEAFTTNG